MKKSMDLLSEPAYHPKKCMPFMPSHTASSSILYQWPHLKLSGGKLLKNNTSKPPKQECLIWFHIFSIHMRTDFLCKPVAPQCSWDKSGTMPGKLSTCPWVLRK